jgi:hypothetical protein
LAAHRQRQEGEAVKERKGERRVRQVGYAGPINREYQRRQFKDAAPAPAALTADDSLVKRLRESSARNHWQDSDEALLHEAADALAAAEQEVARLIRTQDTLLERAAASEQDASRLREALQQIQSWDCLNPPRADLLADLPWLRRIVDAAMQKDAEGKS